MHAGVEVPVVVEATSRHKKEREKMDRFNTVMVLLLVLFLGIVVGPLFLIAGVNFIGGAAVSGFAVPYTMGTWFGAFLIILVLGATGKS